MKPISFGSSYTVILDNIIKGADGLEKVDTMSNVQKHIDEQHYFTPKRNVTEYTAVMYNKQDFKFENYCKMHGIEFRKLDKNELINPRYVIRRMTNPNPSKKLFLITLNTKDFEELLKSQNSNFEHCKEMYEKYYKKDAMKMIESGEPIKGVYMHIQPLMADSVADYVKKYGKDNLNKDSLSIDFIQNCDEPNHCLYFALKDIGVKDIPVYVDAKTRDICNELDLIDARCVG